jgi:cytoskeletal protein CcmA (bactofilin family)
LQTSLIGKRQERIDASSIVARAGKRGTEMFKSKVPESKAPEPRTSEANATPVVTTAPAVTTAAPPRPAPERSAAPAQSTARAEPIANGGTAGSGTVSCIGSGMSITGKIECNGPAQVFGRIEGELRATELVIGDGARIEGSVVAQDVTVCGSVKGTIRAMRVKLQGGGTVEGDIFHRSLSIDENSLFEGVSRRVENPTDTSSIDAAVQRKNASGVGLPPVSPLPAIEADQQRH